MIPEEETIRITNELWNVYFEGSHWKRIEYPSNQGQKNSFERLSKHVQRMIIEARIEQAIESRLENWDIEPRDLNDKEEGFIKGAKSAINNHQNWTDNRIKELKKQLEELK